MSEEKYIKKLLVNKDFLKWAMAGLGGFAAVIIIFGAGVKVGEIKARYSYRWAENYHRNFGGPKEGFFGDWKEMPRGEFMEGHGSFGEIIELNTSTSSGRGSFVIKGRGDMEKIILTVPETIIKNGRDTVEDGLKVGDKVVIIGSPNNEGQIEAKLIRIFNEDGIKHLPYKQPRMRLF